MQKSIIALAACFLMGAAWAQKPDEKGSQAATKSADPPNVQTQTYRGTLVDASCAGNVTQKTPASTESNTADRTDGNKSGKAAADQSQSCAVSANTKEFALRTKDGHVLRFDSVGNERAQEAIKDQKKWNEAASAGKAITVKVSGTLDGDNLTVLTLG
ncbi:MAG TPA: hypothetical protein VG096_00400 [Bryobacteraceae bacterium]|jgi:hypothetical protein|nr:hypothetical protein [Bryobacteraceae bacterium]